MDKFRQLLRGALDVVRLVDTRDALVFGGLAGAVYGVSGYSVPAAWIVGGGVLFLLGMRR